MQLNIPSPSQELKDSFLEKRKLSLWIKRDDLIHPHLSGNKWRKLKFNIQAAKAERKDTLLTFGGAYSNHIAATASAGKMKGLKTIGVIRGNEFKSLNQTLSFAKEEGMHLHFVSREEYNRKAETAFMQSLRAEYGDVFFIPEGGANHLGVRGCAEILGEEEQAFDFICCAAGTGTTAAGLLSKLQNHQQLLVFPALKGGEGLALDILKWNHLSLSKQLHLIVDYHFGGFAKVKAELVDFINTFYSMHQIPLDLIYTGKMMYGLFDLIQKDFFPPHSNILFIHSGGIQGNKGFKNKGVRLFF